LRLFIAINFSQTVKSGLLALRDELLTHSERGRFSQPEHLHLTLAFLGECDPQEAQTAKSIINSISFEPFEIIIDRIGYFTRDGGDTWWAGVRENKALSVVQQSLTNKLTTAGFLLEKRSYKPHITLGREVITRESARPIEPFGQKVSAIELMKSERINGKIIYTVI
jgi:2'-5' RNA ligase